MPVEAWQGLVSDPVHLALHIEVALAHATFSRVTRLAMVALPPFNRWERLNVAKLMLQAEATRTSRTRPRILLVEDYWLVAVHAKLLLEGLNCEVVGPVGNVKEGSYLASQSDLSGAILDIDLGSGDSFPIEEILIARKIPFVFVTGHMATAYPERFQEIPHFNKPYTTLFLQNILGTMRIDLAWPTHRPDG